MDFLKRHIPHIAVALGAMMTLLFPVAAGEVMRAISAWFFRYFDWLTLLAAGAAVIFCVAICLLPVGRTRIGGDEARPEFQMTTWFAMLFAAGMGSGMVFWGAAEPLVFYFDPPPGGALPETPEARREALALTQFHWSIHAWAIYAVAGLVVAIAAGKSQAPLPSMPFAGLSLRWRKIIDWLAIIAVIFGVVASLGQGAIQMATGAERITDGGIMAETSSRVAILIVLTVLYLVSAARGLRRGIAVLSNINLVLAVGLALFIFVAGPTTDILRTFWESLTAYGERIVSLSFTLRLEGEARTWTHGWTLTYLLWWIAWAPFVGVFIARISRGRTLREFVGGVVLVPVAVTLVWFSILGGAALSLTEAGADLGVRDLRTAPESVYALLEYLPLTQMIQILAFALVFVFLLTSADSG
ncbi:MAG: BCCT family transporter, partial [Pseudomonadota bacterium]